MASPEAVLCVGLGVGQYNHRKGKPVWTPGEVHAAITAGWYDAAKRRPPGRSGHGPPEVRNAKQHFAQADASRNNLRPRSAWRRQLAWHVETQRSQVSLFSCAVAGQ